MNTIEFLARFEKKSEVEKIKLVKDLKEVKSKKLTKEALFESIKVKEVKVKTGKIK
jgi:hypothetical protein